MQTADELMSGIEYEISRISMMLAFISKQEKDLLREKVTLDLLYDVLIDLSYID